MKFKTKHCEKCLIHKCFINESTKHTDYYAYRANKQLSSRDVLFGHNSEQVRKEEIRITMFKETCLSRARYPHRVPMIQINKFNGLIQNCLP